jgi:DNA-binding NtrC family response regulator
MQALETYPWPGNVRELQNVVEHTVVLAEPGSKVRPDQIPFMGDEAPGVEGSLAAGWSLDLNEEYHVARERVLAAFERDYITALVNRAGGNMSKAARMAGVDRTTLYRLIEKHDLQRDTILRSK